MYKRFRTHGQSADAEFAVTEEAILNGRALTTQCIVKIRFNSEEFAYYYRLALRTTAGSAAFPDENRPSTVCQCLLLAMHRFDRENTNSDIGLVCSPKCFGGNDSIDVGFDSAANERVWLNQEIFFSWYLQFNSKIPNKPG